MAVLRRVGRVAFSVVAWTLSFAWMAFVLALIAPPTLLGVPWRTLHPLGAGLFRHVMLLTGNRVRVWRDPRLDVRQPAVYCQNHVNLLDAFVAMTAVPSPFCGVMNAWQFWVPVYGWAMTMSRGIAVDRSLPREEKVAALSREASRRRDEGLSILVFPEAHRTRDGRIGGFRLGVFEMARSAGLPVVPVAVRGSRAINRKGTLGLSCGHVVEVRVGAPRETAGLDDAHLAELAETLRTEIASFAERQGASGPPAAAP
ncbi:MAG: 1-acyl-sn-glycerol-3-phosphate acyltransferase [Deltaproteobacteria bacterium]|nr:1-acyl-sn-glycerol-3-phosphate acyltransferase [Deltaproteobacteria bacterium]